MVTSSTQCRCQWEGIDLSVEKISWKSHFHLAVVVFHLQRLDPYEERAPSLLLVDQTYAYRYTEERGQLDLGVICGNLSTERIQVSPVPRF
jgi:hypothetical protein